MYALDTGEGDGEGKRLRLMGFEVCCAGGKGDEGLRCAEGKGERGDEIGKGFEDPRCRSSEVDGAETAEGFDRMELGKLRPLVGIRELGCCDEEEPGRRSEGTRVMYCEHELEGRRSKAKGVLCWDAIEAVRSHCSA